MSDRTFRLILDGKKGGLVKGTTPSSAAKKVGFYTNSVKTGKSSIKFELQETTKGSKKKVYGPYKIKVKMAGGGHENNKPSWDTHPFEKYFPKVPVISKNSLEIQLRDLYNLQKKFKNEFSPNNTQFNNKIANLEKQIRESGTHSIANNKDQRNSRLSPSLPPFVVNSSFVVKSSNDLENRVNLNTSDLDKLIKIKPRIKNLYDKFSKELGNKKRSVINSLGELSKNSKPLSKTALPSLKNIRLKPNKNYGSNINFANYNLQESLLRGDIEQKFYELSHFYEKINNLIHRIQETLKK